MTVWARAGDSLGRSESRIGADRFFDQAVLGPDPFWPGCGHGRSGCPGMPAFCILLSFLRRSQAIQPPALIWLPSSLCLLSPTCLPATTRRAQMIPVVLLFNSGSSPLLTPCRQRCAHRPGSQSRRHAPPAHERVYDLCSSPPSRNHGQQPPAAHG